MKQFCFLLVLLQFSSQELRAQQDLTVSDTSKQIMKDSIYPGSLVAIDSSYNITNPWGYPPPCIIPQLWRLDTFNLSSILYFPTFVFNSPYNKEGAKAAIKAGKPFILFPGGPGGIPDFKSQKDKEFQKKYHVKFFSQGCTHLGENENEAGYNQVIFEYLDQKYGDEWRLELPNDAIGFEAPELPIPDLGSIAMQIAHSVNSGNPAESVNSDPETSIWWYVLPTSGFALLLSLYFIKRKKD